MEMYAMANGVNRRLWRFDNRSILWFKGGCRILILYLQYSYVNT